MKFYLGYWGSGVFAEVARARGHDVNGCDADPSCGAPIVDDMLAQDPARIAEEHDAVFLGPMCTSFSLASGNTHWTEDRQPRTVTAVVGRAHLRHCLKILEECNRRGKPCFIENPNGRAVWFMPEHYRKWVTYCQYGDKAMKPTNWWTNSRSWIPRPACKNGDPCHEQAPRGSKTGTQGKKGAKERGIWPPELCEEMILAVEKDAGIVIQEVLAYGN